MQDSCHRARRAVRRVSQTPGPQESQELERNLDSPWAWLWVFKAPFQPLPLCLRDPSIPPASHRPMKQGMWKWPVNSNTLSIRQILESPSHHPGSRSPGGCLQQLTSVLAPLRCPEPPTLSFTDQLPGRSEGDPGRKSEALEAPGPHVGQFGSLHPSQLQTPVRFGQHWTLGWEDGS